VAELSHPTTLFQPDDDPNTEFEIKANKSKFLIASNLPTG
jgi:hypothetical protein